MSRLLPICAEHFHRALPGGACTNVIAAGVQLFAIPNQGMRQRRDAEQIGGLALMQGTQPRHDRRQAGRLVAAVQPLYPVQAQRNDGIQPLPLRQRLSLQQACQRLLRLGELACGRVSVPIQSGDSTGLRVSMRQIPLPRPVVRLLCNQRFQYLHAGLRVGLRLRKVAARQRQIGGA